MEECWPVPVDVLLAGSGLDFLPILCFALPTLPSIFPPFPQATLEKLSRFGTSLHSILPE